MAVVEHELVYTSKKKKKKFKKRQLSNSAEVYCSDSAPLSVEVKMFPTFTCSLTFSVDCAVKGVSQKKHKEHSVVERHAKTSIQTIKVLICTTTEQKCT